MKKLSEYVKTAEAAEILGVFQTTLRKWAETGKIPVRLNPPNGYRMFLHSDREDFLCEAANPVKSDGTKKAR